MDSNILHKSGYLRHWERNDYSIEGQRNQDFPGRFSGKLAVLPGSGAGSPETGEKEESGFVHKNSTIAYGFPDSAAV